MVAFLPYEAPNDYGYKPLPTSLLIERGNGRHIRRNHEVPGMRPTKGRFLPPLPTTGARKSFVSEGDELVWFSNL